MTIENPRIEPKWGAELSGEFNSSYFLDLRNFLIEEKKRHVIFPRGADIFKAFDRTPFDKVKAVIIGQDPYHGSGQANGLCFSVAPGIPQPPSLKNIFKELKDDLGYELPKSGDLGKWADQGVLLLNATLTVRADLAGSHQKKGWEQFTDAAIRILSGKRMGIVFLLWGRFAQMKEALIDKEKHFILKAAHPSPLAGGAFFGCRHFSKTNDILLKNGNGPIDWSLE